MLFQVIRNVEICAPITDSLPQVLGCFHSSKIHPLIQQHQKCNKNATQFQFTSFNNEFVMLSGQTYTNLVSRNEMISI